MAWQEERNDLGVMQIKRFRKIAECQRLRWKNTANPANKMKKVVSLAERE